MQVVLIYIFIAICAFIVFKNRRKVTLGVLKTQSGHVYSYAVGDYLKSETMSFNGLDITLPYKLANFYLDSHKDSKHSGPGALYDRRQMVSLEGDFDRYFQLFVPLGEATPVLSVLSPDVMQTLISHSSRYDVELCGEHLRIMTKEKIDPLNTQSLLHAAETILGELEHRATSWQPGTDSAKLLYKKGATLTLFGRYLRRSHLLVSISVVLLAIAATGMGLAAYYTHLDPHFSNPYEKGPILGTLMYVAAGVVLTAIPIIMLAPLVWFAFTRPDKDIFPTK